jgi:hypothetical protein
MDLSKLDDEQIKVALKVIASAKKHGINPDFVLPMVNQESAFKSSAKSSAGALGPMQLMPDTAKDLGVDPSNVDENIDGGMRFLKGLIENKKLGGDPRNIFAAYNAGPNAKFFSTGDLKDLPNETVNHVVKIMGSYGENVPELTLTSTEAPKAASEPSTGVSEGSSQAENQYGATLIGDGTAEGTKKGRDTSALETGAISSLVGAGAGSVYEAKAPAVRLAQRVGLLPGGKTITPTDAVELAERVMTPNAPATSGARKTHGGENWQKSLTGISTPGAQMDKASLDLAKGMNQAVTGGAPGFTGGKITEGGIILNPRDAAAVDAKQQAAIAKAAENETRFQQMMEKANKPNAFKQAASRAVSSAPVKGSLAGLGVGFNAQDAYNKFDQGDYVGGSLASGAAGASGLSLVPKLARTMGPAAIGLTTASQVAGDLNRGDKQSAAESGLSGLAAMFPRIFGPLGSAVYSRGLNEGEDEELARRRKMKATISP